MPLRKRGWIRFSDKACPREGGGCALPPNAPTPRRQSHRSSSRGRERTTMRRRVERVVSRRFAMALLALVALGGSLAPAPARAESVADFYRGKQIILMVGSSPGGGYDAIARLVARHLGNYIPGNPSIVVQNTPGGGSLTMTNRIYRVAP